MKYLIMFFLALLLLGAICGNITPDIPATSCDCPPGWYAYQFGERTVCRQDFTSQTGQPGFHIQGCEK